MEHALALATMLVPVLVSILTVPILDGLKRISTAIDGLPGWVKQILAVFVAYGLTQGAALAQLPLPDQLHLVTEVDVQSVLSAIGAWAIHAGRKASEPSIRRAI
jgi:hypothetical protein